MFNTSSIALIVGGSSGMGKATAERLLKSGVPVMILSHDRQNLAEAKLIWNQPRMVMLKLLRLIYTTLLLFKALLNS